MSYMSRLPLIIHEDGRREDFYEPKCLEDGYSIEEIQEAMGSDEMINILRCKNGVTMIVFDDGRAMGLGVNEDGTKLYREIGGKQGIVGRVFLCISEWIQ